MVDEETESRRKILKSSAAFAGGIALPGVSGAVSDSPQIRTNFDQHEFIQVDQFVDEVFSGVEYPYQKLLEWEKTGEMDYLFEELSKNQLVAFMDAIRPSYVKKESEHSSASLFSLFNTSANPSVVDTEMDTISEDPIKKWGWESATNKLSRHKDAQRTFSSMSSTPSSQAITAPVSGGGGSGTYSSETISKTISALALSLDVIAYKWQGTVSWDYNGDRVKNVNAYDTVKFTNSVTSHRKTDIDKNKQKEFFQIRFQGKFANGAGKICDPVFNAVCIDISQKFKPYIQLRGDKNGNGEHINSGDDAIDGDIIIKEVQERI